MNDENSIDQAQVGENRQPGPGPRINLKKLYGVPISVPIGDLPNFTMVLVEAAVSTLEQSYNIDDCEFEWNQAELVKAGLTHQIVSIITDLLDKDLQELVLD